MFIFVFIFVFVIVSEVPNNGSSSNNEDEEYDFLLTIGVLIFEIVEDVSLIIFFGGARVIDAD